MGMFDTVHFEMNCPECGEVITDFQSKDAECNLETIEPDCVDYFYSGCKCGIWITFERQKQKPEKKLREKSLTIEELKEIGFVMDIHQKG